MVKIVLDFEMTCDMDKRNVSPEIIEIGAVKLDEENNIIGRLQTYIKPDHLEYIGAKCKEITGITPETVADAPIFTEIIPRFANWIGSDEVTIYAWSDSDEKQFKAEYKRKFNCEGIPAVFNTWEDLQQDFAKLFNISRRSNLAVAINVAGITFEGQEHSALSDAINTAKLMQIMKDKSSAEKIEDSMAKIFNTKNETFGSSIGDLLKAKFNM